MMELLDQAEGQRRYERGDVVNGTIALVNDDEILIDVGGKYEGILAPREFHQLSHRDRQTLSVGDEVECFVLNPEDRHGNLVLSLNQARMSQDWEEAERLFAEGSSFDAGVSGHNKGGLILYVGQVRGFVPASQIDRRHAIDRSTIDGSVDSPLSGLVGQTIHVKIIEIDRRKNRLILSEQAAMRERRRQSKVELLDSLAESQVLDGVVTSLADFGAFVDIGGADGLVHLSELSWNRVSHPREVLQLGQSVTVKVIAVDRDRKRIGLSIKQLQPEPWSDLAERFPVGSIVPGTVTRLTEFGAFARLDGDIEGLIHVSELSDDGQAPEAIVAPGQQLMLRVIRVDPDRRRIGLSLKRADPAYDEQAPSAAPAEVEPPAEAAQPDAAEESALPEAPVATDGAAAIEDIEPALATAPLAAGVGDPEAAPSDGER
jgi:small subunit ribosomal protein S1